MTKKTHCKKDNAISPVISEIILIALSVLIIALLFACILGMIPSFGSDVPEPGEILKIIDVSDIDKGVVILKNIDTKSLVNKDYSAKVYVDDKEQLVIIQTLSDYGFISTRHYGVKLIDGAGPSGIYWKPGEEGMFDLKDGIIRAGSLLRIDIVRNFDDKVISVSEYPVSRRL